MRIMTVLFPLMFYLSVFPQKHLSETSWKVLAINGEHLTLDSAELPVLIFLKERINGFTSCNKLLGNYELHRKKISFSQIGGTKMFCPDPFQHIEQTFYQALSAVVFWKIKKEKLFFYDKHKACILVLKKSNSTHETN